MIHSLTPSRCLLRRAALAGLAGTVFVSLTAAAQVGDLGRRARDAATRAPGAQPTGDGAVTFDDVTLELTPARVEQYIKGLRASKAALERQDRSSWNALAERRDAASNAAADLQERNHDAFTAFEERHATVLQCREEEIRNANELRRQETMQRAMADVNVAMRFAELSQAYQAAQARGDTAEMNRISKEMDRSFGGATRADTAAAHRKCGPLPTRPPAMARRDSLQAVADTLNERLRRLETEADTAAVIASGMTAHQLFIAGERIGAFLGQEPKAGHVYRGFTVVEVKALTARREELVALM